MKKILFTLVLVLATQFAFSQDKPSKAEVEQVIEKSGASGQMAAAKKQVLSMIPKEKQAAFVVEFDALIKKVSDATVELYIQEYTKEDIKAMLVFYNSPVGKKMAEKSEIIAQKSQESMVALQGEMQALVMKYMQ